MAWLTLLAWVGGLGGALLAVGALILLWLRAADPRLKPYTASKAKPVNPGSRQKAPKVVHATASAARR